LDPKVYAAKGRLRIKFAEQYLDAMKKEISSLKIRICETQSEADVVNSTWEFKLKWPPDCTKCSRANAMNFL